MPDVARQNDDKQRVKDAADIVDVVGSVVALKPKGREFVGLCPFHDDRNPSMYVVPHKQMFTCFVCGAGGDVFTFVQRYHRMDFREALEHLAERFNVTLTPWQPGRDRSAAGQGGGAGSADGADGGEIDRKTLVQVNATAAAFYQALLAHPEHGAAGRALIERRGISPEMVEAFRLGVAPDRWDGLALFAQKKGIDPGALFALGLLKPRQDGSPYDALRNRLIFPILDQPGRTIAFGARRIDDQDEPKYLNSPDTPLFDKSRTLYGLHQAGKGIREQNRALVVEGYTDVIACHQHGFPIAVATLGTALTRQHAKVLRRLCDTVILLFDGDEAGRRASERAFEVFLSENIDVRVASLARFTDAKDPDELFKRGDGAAETFERCLSGAEDLLEFHFAHLREKAAGLGMAAKRRLAEEQFDLLNRAGIADCDPMRRDQIVRRLAQITGIDFELIAQSLRSGRRARAPEAEREAGPAPAATFSASDRALPQVQVLACLLADPLLAETLHAADLDLLRRSPYPRAAHELVRAMVALLAAGERPGLHEVIDRLDGADAPAALAAALSREASRASEDRADRLRRHFDECLERLRAAATERELKAARPANDDPAALRAHMDRLRRTLNTETPRVAYPAPRST